MARDAFLYAGSTSRIPPDPSSLRRIAGYGSSPVVTYEGAGIYFLDKVRDGLWRLEVYPDAVPVQEPFEPPNANKVITRAIHRPWPMTITLPDLGDAFTIQPVTQGNAASAVAVRGRFTVEPGVYVVSRVGPVDRATLPATLGSLGFAEYHAPSDDVLPVTVQPLTGPEYSAGRTLELSARIVDRTSPDSVHLLMRPAVGGFYRAFPMRITGAYHYTATIPATAIPRDGPYEYVITLFRKDSITTFPARVPGRPWDWNYSGHATWTLNVAAPRTPIVLFDPVRDATRLAFTRIGDAGRRGLFRVGLSDMTGRPVFHLALPVDTTGWSPPDYTASLVVSERLRSRGEPASGGDTLFIHTRGLGSRQTLHVTLMEDDGTSWTTSVTLDAQWRDVALPLATFTIGRGVLLPQGFPGQWSYWVGPASGRGGPGDRVRLDRVERLQLSIRPEAGVTATPDGYGMEVESVILRFGKRD